MLSASSFNPVVPISATQTGPTAPIIVTFSEPLVGGVSAALNWDGVVKPGVGQRRWVVALGNPVISGSTVTVIPKRSAIAGGSARIDYDASPPDVVSALTGHPASAFTDYPVT